jgi:hypothetical protein
MYEDKTRQEPEKLTADDALNLLFALGYGQKFSSPSSVGDFRAEFPKVYEESGFDFVHAICVIVGRKLPLIRGMRSGKIGYRMDSGIYHRFSDDFQRRYDRFLAEQKSLLDDKIPIEKIIKGLEGKVQQTIDEIDGAQETEEDTEVSPDEEY